MTDSLNLLTKEYDQTGTSKKLNNMGMREMQQLAFEKRNSQYLLLKSPPASGKSRAMMFLALDKLINQGIKKVVIIVPEMSIGKSFANTSLMQYGFFADWQVDRRYNLCLNTLASDDAKTKIFEEFMQATPTDKTRVLVCTHHSFRFGYDKVGDVSLFNNVLLGVDEFHHVSAADNNRLGAILDEVIKKSTAHMVAMTGSYFRGDSIPILTPEDEERFDKVTYSYYDQLNGYQYLKSLSLDYKFYDTSFFQALHDCLDVSKKTIVHIPNVNSQSAETDKYETVRKIIDVIGEPIAQDQDTGIWTIKTHDGNYLKLADLVTDDELRPRTQVYLSQIKNRDEMDIIIALGMAKEGFDWTFCEHVLTIGYRGSMTEVVQIIGRATRDCEGKQHAQFTNLIAKPDARQDDVVSGVNDMLKAISLSLLMEQVLAPNLNFRRRSTLTEGETPRPGTIIIDDGKDGSKLSKRAEEILNKDADEIIAMITQDPNIVSKYIASDEGKKAIDPQIINDNVLPQIIRKRYPNQDLSEQEIDQIMQGVLTKIAINSNGGVVDGSQIPADAQVDNEKIFIKRDGKYIEIIKLSDAERAKIQEDDKIRQRDLPENAIIFDPKTNTSSTNTQNNFVKMGEKFINVDMIPIDLIHSVNPFANAYEVLSKSIDSDVLKLVNDVVKSSKAGITEAEAAQLWSRIQQFVKKHGREPSPSSTDPIEVRMAQVLSWVRVKKAEQLRKQQRDEA